MKKITRILCQMVEPIFLISGFLGLVCLNTLGQEREWIPKANLPVIRAGFSVNYIDGKLFVIGGEVYNPGNALADVSIYDIIADEWTAGTPMPTARFLIPKLTIGNKIYAIGGNKTSLAAGQKVEVYDVSTDEWSSVADLPTSRVYPAGCVLDSQIYVMGGWSLDMISGPDIYGLDIMERYDPATDTWDTCAPMPTGRFAFTACALNGKIYAIGGSKPMSEDFGAYATVEEFDPNTDQWTTKNSMNHPRFELTCTVIGDKIWAMYGFPNGSGFPVYPHYEVYDPSNDTWTPHEGSDELHPDGSAAIHAISADRLYILGGYSGSVGEQLRSEVYVYDSIGVGVRELANQECRFFPNPAGEQLSIQTNLTGLFEMEIINLNGQLVYSGKNGSTHGSGRSLLLKIGVYFITIRAEDYTLQPGSLSSCDRPS